MAPRFLLVDGKIIVESQQCCRNHAGGLIVLEFVHCHVLVSVSKAELTVTVACNQRHADDR
jgi:hypothetical protein